MTRPFAVITSVLAAVFFASTLAAGCEFAGTTSSASPVATKLTTAERHYLGSVVQASRTLARARSSADRFATMHAERKDGRKFLRQALRLMHGLSFEWSASLAPAVPSGRLQRVESLWLRALIFERKAFYHMLRGIQAPNEGAALVAVKKGFRATRKGDVSLRRAIEAVSDVAAGEAIPSLTKDFGADLASLGDEEKVELARALWVEVVAEAEQVPCDMQRLNDREARFAVTAMAAELGRPEGVEEAPTYYVKNGGNDSLDGRSDATAWATVAKVNCRTFSPGQSIGFKCGDTWREKIVPASSGSAAGQITYRSYGTGAKPKFLGGLDLSSSSGWTEYSTNKWRWNSTTALITCALWMNDHAAWGRQKAAIADLTTQGDFCWVSGYTYLYSTSNPGTYYTNMESALNQVGCHTGSRNYLTIRGLDFRYWGSGGITCYPSTGHLWEYNDVSYIGPNTLSFQAGNGIGGQAQSDSIVRYNRVHMCLDAGLSTINYNTDGTLHSNQFYGNVVSNCEYGYEQQSYDTGNYNDIQIYGNVFYNMGDTIWHDSRASNDKYGNGLQSWSHANATASSCLFNDNIVYRSLLRHVQRPAVGWTCQGNRYYPDGPSMFRIYGGSFYNFAGWQGGGHDTTGALIDEIEGTDAEIIAALAVMAMTAR